MPAAGVDPLKYQQPSPRPASASAAPVSQYADELMTVKLRYKAPDATESTLISVPVQNRAGNVEALGFPAAVAAFGMLLRGSEHKGSASWSMVETLATKHKGNDAHGHRAEFVRLIGVADGISRLRMAHGNGGPR